MRIQIHLTPDEAQALAEWSARQMRHPRLQARYALRQALIQAGCLSGEEPAEPDGDLILSSPFSLPKEA